MSNTSVASKDDATVARQVVIQSKTISATGSISAITATIAGSNLHSVSSELVLRGF